jgi:hypothetical protein
MSPNGELVPRKPHRLARQRLGDSRKLEHHATGLDDRDPSLGRALPGSHPGLRGLLGEGLVGIDVDPHLAATLDLSRHRDSSGLDLTVGKPSGVQRLQPVVAKLDLDLPARHPGSSASVMLAEFDALWREHQR